MPAKDSTILESTHNALLGSLVSSETLSSASSQIITILDKSSQILDVICRYRSLQSETTAHHSDEGCLKQLVTIYGRVKRGSPVQLVLPGFPFKSPNKRVKVLGKLPDKAEEFALAHLNGLCAAIQDIYPPGAELTIVSDGLVYNDLLGVPDIEVWAYGEALRSMAHSKGFKHINFARINDLVHLDLPEAINEMVYVTHASQYRSSLIDKFTRTNWDASKEILENEDTRLTYRGYIKFLMTDLVDVFPLNNIRSAKAFKRGIEAIAKAMLERGQAFAHAVRESFPQHVRLSIHASTGESKISVSLLPTDSSFTTPWHCAVAFALDGTLISGHRATFDADTKYKLIYDSQNRPSHYLEQKIVELLYWDGSVNPVIAEPMYPCGWQIRPDPGMEMTMDSLDTTKLRALAQHNSPVVLRGFKHSGNRASFVGKAHELGMPLSWTFGLVLDIKDRGTNTQGLNNTLSAECMPFHYDGIFKTKKTGNILADGTEELVPDPPHFQFFTAVTKSPPDTGYTLFAASSRIWKYLPSALPLETLQRLTWNVKTTAWNSPRFQGLKLIEAHPSTGKPVLRFHENWPQNKTAFESILVNIENVDEKTSAEICATLESLLHDRRVCYWHSWEKGDVLINDNLATMHTRTGFAAGSDRELWRIHVD